VTKRRRGQVVRTAGGAVVRIIDGLPHLLLIRDPYEKWGFPKGHAENGEAPHQTALREVSEETGLTDLELGPELATIEWTFRARGKEFRKFATFYLMYSREGVPRPEVSEGITEIEWVRLDTAHERLSYANAVAVVQAAQMIVLDGKGTAPQTGRSQD